MKFLRDLLAVLVAVYLIFFMLGVVDNAYDNPPTKPAPLLACLNSQGCLE